MTLFSPVNREELFTAALIQKGWTNVPPFTNAAVNHDSSRFSFPQRLEIRLPDRTAAASVGVFETSPDSAGATDLLAFVNFAPDGREPDPAEHPAALFRKYLDLSLLERLSLWSIGSRHRPRFLLCATSEGCSLFETSGETLIGQCAAYPDAEQASQCLRSLEPNARTPQPLPDPERLSKELSRWLDLFCGTIGPCLKWSRRDAERLARHLLLGLKVLLSSASAEFPSELKRLGASISEKNGTATAQWEPVDPLELFDLLLEASGDFFPKGAGAFSALERKGIVRQLRGIDPAKLPATGEILRLSNIRLRAQVLLPIIVPADQEHASWKLALIEPLSVADEMDKNDLYVFAPLTLDLAECGFGRVLEALEMLAAHALERIRRLTSAGSWQLDMLEAAAGHDAEEILANPLNWICGRAIRLKVGREWREPLAYLVASHLLELRARPEFQSFAAQPVTTLPEMFV